MSTTASSAAGVSILVPTELQGPLLAFLARYAATQSRPCADPQQLHDAEQTMADAADQLCAAAMQPIVQKSVSSQEPSARRRSTLLPPALRAFLLPAKRFKNQGRRPVHLRLSRGPAIRIRVTYYSRNGDRRAHRAHKGGYPALCRLGIFDRVSPRLASHAALAVALSGSFEEALEHLRLQGVSLNVKTLRNLAYRFASRARARLRQKAYQLPSQPQVAGLTVVAQLDGGRARLRQDKRGRRKKSGRHGYHTPWREPKLLMIYAVDEQGKRSKAFAPIIDGTFEPLEQSQEIFAQLVGYLRALGVKDAKQVVFLGDGAKWIAPRIPNLLADLELRQDQVKVVLDFYHAVEHLGDVANTQKKWSKEQKQAWVKQQRKRLYTGCVERVLAEVARLSQGSRSKVLRREYAYFLARKEQMRYRELKRAGLPIGSGAVESAIRRVVNLRLKGAGIFWLQANAAAVLLLRSYAKVGRWRDLTQLALSLDLFLAA